LQSTTSRSARPYRRKQLALFAVLFVLTGLALAVPAARPAHAAECHPDAPATLVDYIPTHNSAVMKRVDCNTDVAVYFDSGLQQIPATETAWVSPFITDVWRYFKQEYGSFAVPRTLAAPIGPGCDSFGAPKPLIAFLHRDVVRGGTGLYRFRESSGFRNTIDVGSPSWSAGFSALHDLIIHEACHQVELAGQGVLGSPALTVWGDSKWAEFCMYDFYARTGRTADAKRVFSQFFNNRDKAPFGAVNAAWFRDWFFPLWRDNGGNPDVMERFFGLLSMYFPKQPENGGRSLVYSRRMTTGEYVHFMSGAAGVDLSARAAFAFNTGFNRAEFEKAKADFPDITYRPATATPTGMILGVAGKCVDVSGAHAANGAAIQLYTCNGTDAQRWTVGTDGTLKALGKCADVTAASPANGAKVQLYDCNGTGAQVWQHQPNGTLRNPQSNKCLDATDNTSADGTPLQIWDCYGGANQLWRLPA
jgi:hypothetical protein